MMSVAQKAPRGTTAMSVPRRDRKLARPGFTKRFHALTKLACVVLLANAPMGCVIPPPLDLGLPDAGVNAPPTILSIRDEAATDLSEPGPMVLSRGTGTISVTVLETDLADDAYIRVFVDYNRPDPTSARAACKAAASGLPRRTVTCDVGGVCQQSDIGAERLVWVEVFDREPLDTGTPRFRAMPADGLSTHWQFFLRCQEPQL